MSTWRVYKFTPPNKFKFVGKVEAEDGPEARELAMERWPKFMPSVYPEGKVPGYVVEKSAEKDNE